MFKYKILILSLVIIFVLSISIVSARIKINELPLFGKIIYIDPGHGGTDPGALYKDIYEKDINLKISKKIEKVLTEAGAIVYLTRYGDYDLSVPNTVNRKRSDLSRRGNIINRSDCDIFLSIHLNSDVSSLWQGAQVFYDDTNKNNKEIAEIIQKYFKSDLGSKRKAKQINDLYLQKRVTKPGILIEAGFISNSNDRYKLKQNWYQEKIATTIYKALLEYFKKK